MSRYAHEYREAEPLTNIIERMAYDSMMRGKRDIERFGANALAAYRARRRAT